VASSDNDRAPEDFTVTRRTLNEALATGLSSPPASCPNDGPTLGDFARVLRGVATGANDYFFLTSEQARAGKIPNRFFVPAIGRTRDVPENEVTPELITSLEKQGRPTLLLSLNSKPREEYPASVLAYLRIGEKQGLPDRPLISQRRPWYKMESRAAPPFLFAFCLPRPAKLPVHSQHGGRHSADLFPLRVSAAHRPEFPRGIGAGAQSPGDNRQFALDRKVVWIGRGQSGTARVGKAAAAGTIGARCRSTL
jgi:hypothetical protein